MRPAARSCSACVGSPWSATAAPGRRASPTPCALPPARSRWRRWSGPRPSCGRPAPVVARSPPPIPAKAAARDRKSTMTREEVLRLVREHLSEELEVDAAKIGEQTRFKEDLDADSLDLYELVMELEDRYGVSVSEEQASRIATVGDAVDFVVEHAPAA